MGAALERPRTPVTQERVPVAGLVFVPLAMYFRVMMEILIVVFRGVECLAEIAADTKGSGGGRAMS